MKKPCWLIALAVIIVAVVAAIIHAQPSQALFSARVVRFDFPRDTNIVVAITNNTGSRVNYAVAVRGANRFSQRGPHGTTNLLVPLHSFWDIKIDGRRDVNVIHLGLARLRIRSVPDLESVILSLDGTNSSEWVRSNRRQFPVNL